MDRRGVKRTFADFGMGMMMGVPMMNHPLMNKMGDRKPTSSNKIKVLFDPSLKKTSLEQIFNIVPGFVSLEFIEMVEKGAVAGITYDNPLSAQHALERIQGLEYPVGVPLEIDMVEPEKEAEPVPEREEHLQPQYDAQMLCSVKMPQEAKEMLDPETPVAMSIFFSVSKIHDPFGRPSQALYRNMFSRYGDLIDLIVIRERDMPGCPGRNGLAKFASVESAEKAMDDLHNAYVGEYKLLVVESKESIEARKKAAQDAADGGSEENGDAAKKAEPKADEETAMLEY